MKLPRYQVEAPSGQWGFSTLYALNVWIKVMKVDPKSIRVYETYEMIEEEWKEDDTRTNEAATL